MKFVRKTDVAHLGDTAVPTGPYYEDAYFEAERARIFRKTWLFFGRQEEIPNPGDYRVREYEVCSASVLVTRDQSGDLRAFHNVCSHRLARLVDTESGSAKGFSCPYHGWRYDLDGSLRSVPDSENFCTLERDDTSLSKITLGEWNGFVFINFDPNPAQSIEEFLGGVSARLSEHDLSSYSSYVVMGAELDINWKCILDNFQETYHLSFVHNLSVGDRSVGNANPTGRPLSFEFFGPHRLMGVWGNPEHKTAPVEGVAVSYGGVISAGATQQTAESMAIRPENWQLDVFGIFPNLLVDIAPTFYFIHEFIPLSAGRTRWTTRMFFPPATSMGQRFSQEYSIAAFRDTVAEDLAILRGQQKSLYSGAKTRFHFQASEAMCRHSFNVIDARVHETELV